MENTIKGMDFANTTRTAENRTKWREIVAESSVVPQTNAQGYGIDYTHGISEDSCETLSVYAGNAKQRLLTRE